MKIPKVDFVIEVSKNLLNDQPTYSPQIEMYLTIYLLILASAEFEKKIKQIVIERVEQAKDPSFVSFAETYLEDHVTNPQTKAIKEKILKKFGGFYINKFKENLKKIDNAENSFNSIITNRNEVAHGTDIKITFNDFLNYYENGHQVLDILKEVLIGE